MSRAMTVQECDQAVSELLPDLPRPEQKSLAALVSGGVLEQDATLSRASAGIPGAAHERSKQRRAQRLWANPRLDVPRAQRRLLARVLQGRRGRLDLLLDATTTGATAHQAGTVTLVLALGGQGRALPLVWRSWTADEPGQDWSAAIQEMLAMVQALLPPDVQVLLLADRGLSGAPLAHAAQALGWHYLLRVQYRTCVCHPDGTVQSLAELVPTPGTQCLLTDVHLCKKGHPSWATTPRANVVAVRRAVDREPWLLVTDLPATLRRCTD
jgi:transposase InsO family protein